MTDPAPEPEILTVGKPPRTTDDDSTAPETEAVSLLLPALWLASAVALVLAPFLSFTKYEIRQDGDLAAGYEANGWGSMSDLGEGTIGSSHTPRFGIVLVLLAAALLVAAGAARWYRSATWPARLGTIASAMTVSAAAVVIIVQESFLSNETTVSEISYEMSVGIGVGVVLLGAIIAGVALAIALVNEHRGELPSRRRRDEQRPGTIAE